MKKYILIITFSILALTLAFLINRNKYSNTENSKNESEILVENDEEITVESDEEPTSIGDDRYQVSWVKLNDFDELYLISNIDEKLTSSDAEVKHKCKYLVNAGFIDKKGKHIGLFKNKEGKISNSVNSKTLNGYFYVDENRNFHISSSKPVKSLIALQSGPILMENNRFFQLSLVNDENSRRVVSAVTRQGDLVFIAFYNKNNPLLGPKLSELTQILEDLENNTSLNFTEAINLDGGFHSAFLVDSKRLPEASIIGGYFCIK